MTPASQFTRPSEWLQWVDTQLRWPPGGGYGPNATMYAELAGVVGPAVRAAAGNATLIGPASSNIGMAWLQQSFEAGLLQHIDRVSIHPYRSDSPETLWADWPRVGELVSEYAPLEKAPMAVLSGEWGYGADTVGGAMEQAELLVRVMLLTTALSGQPSIWYQACDPDVSEGSMGIMNCSDGVFTPLPAYSAALVLHTVLRNDGQPATAPLDPGRGFRFVQRLPVFQAGISAEDDFVLLYRSADEQSVLLVAWTSSGFSHVLRLPGVGPGECFAQQDMMGAKQAQVCHDPRGLHANVTSAPLYLVRTGTVGQGTAS
eukprot:TRINITY_DN38584_c0_g1_i1.p1 TRINITY_DN38584_c0_g1~~TRINITY_DN38584_c0_g1_i1.p1  ORF type:complete len:316 (+),score=46.39 TRINITY_DN38584_c0_g1_i1:264-1211(+)